MSTKKKAVSGRKPDRTRRERKMTVAHNTTRISQVGTVFIPVGDQERALTAGPPKSTPKASAKSFVLDQPLPFRRLFSHLIHEISWIGTRGIISSWTRCFLAGLEKKGHDRGCAI